MKWLCLLAMVLVVSYSGASTTRVAGSGGVIVLQFGQGFDGELGAQRAQVFVQAAQTWAELLVIVEPVVVQADFVNLSCSNAGAVLGSAGPASYMMDFDGAQAGNTWYPIALANQMAGKDLNPGGADIRAQFNAAIDSGCFGGQTWYYGSGDAPDGQFAFLQTVMHELGHGLGFTTVLELDNGSIAAGGEDHYIRHIKDLAGNRMTDMSPQQRMSAVTSGALYWHGLIATARAQSVSGSSEIAMHVPQTLRSGSTLSHFSSNKVNAGAPEETMQPFYMKASTPWLADAALADMGWGVVWRNAYVEFRPSGTAISPGSPAQVQMTVERALALQEGIQAIEITLNSGVLSVPAGCQSNSARSATCPLLDLPETDVVSLPLQVVSSVEGQVVLQASMLRGSEEGRTEFQSLSSNLAMTLNFVNPYVPPAPQKVGSLSWSSVLFLLILLPLRRKVAP